MHSDSGLMFSSQPPDLVKKRMMVAEVGGRGQSGSPINGEMACGMSGRDSYLSQHDVLLSPLSPVSSVSGGEYYGGSGGGDLSPAHLKRKELFTQRKQREFIPDNKKDDNYWDRRRRNNEAAKRSREKRRFNDMVLEQRVVELTKENHVLKAQLEAIKEEYGICGEQVVCVEKVLATLPTSDQVLSMTKRPKLCGSVGVTVGGGVGGGPALMLAAAAAAAASIPTPVIHQPIHAGGDADGMHSPPHQVQQSSTADEPAGYEPDYHHLHAHAPFHHAYHHQLAHQHPHQHQHVHQLQHQLQHNQHQQPLYEQDALNLSARSRPRSRPRSPYDVSSGAEDEPPSRSLPPPHSADSSNNSLPLKLRHKSHLGDKDQAASALLALHAIKQEPTVAQSAPCAAPAATHRASSTPPWDAEGSSDERDSGISLGAEWTPAPSDNKQRLHSEIVRLSTEVANLKSLVIRTNN